MGWPLWLGVMGFVLIRRDDRHPRPKRSVRSCFGSSTILTGMRCAILVKLPVALSGGSRLNCDPLAGEIVST